MEKWEIFNDNFQNYKSRHLPKAQFVIADIPYNLGVNAYGFEINKEFASKAKEWLDASYEPDLFVTMDELDKKAEIEKRKNK